MMKLWVDYLVRVTYSELKLYTVLCCGLASHVVFVWGDFQHLLCIEQRYSIRTLSTPQFLI